jgi:hypothetical protein
MVPSLVLALLAASAVAYPSPPAVLSAVDEARLARFFAPVLVYHPEERFFPVDPSTSGEADDRAGPRDTGLEGVDVRTARYLALPRPTRTAMAAVYYRVTVRSEPDRRRVSIEYFFYYLGNPYRSRGGVIPIWFNLWHPHDLERVLVVVEFLANEEDVAARPEQGRVRAIYPSAHGDSMPDNIRRAPGAGSLALPLRLMVELGSHAMALDATGSGVFVPGTSADGPRKFTWGIRDRGAPWAWYRQGYMAARRDDAVVLGPSVYRLEPAARMTEALDTVEKSIRTGDRAARPGWVVRSFGEASPDTLLKLPVPASNPDAAYGERRAARRERGFEIAASNLLSQFSVLAGGRWLVSTPWLLPDILLDAEGVLTYDGRFYTLVDLLATYRLDFGTRLFVGGGPLARWWSLTTREVEWE